MLRILHITEDDDLHSVRDQLESSEEELDLRSTTSIKDALDRAETQDFDFIVYECREGGTNGLDLLTTLRSRNIDTTVILSSHSPVEESIRSAYQLDGSAHVETTESEGATALPDLLKQITDVKKGKLAGDIYSAPIIESPVFFRTLFEEFPLPVMVVDSDGRIVLANEALLSYLRYATPGDLIGSPAIKLFPLAYNNAGMGDIRSMLHHEEESRNTFHWRIVNHSGDHVTVEATGYTFTVSSRRMAAFVIQDVRARESAELVKSKDKSRVEAVEDYDVTTLVVCDGVVMKSGLQLILSEKSEKFMYFEYSEEVLSAISSFSCDTVLYACTTCDQTAVREAKEILKHSGRKPVMIAALSGSNRWINEAIKAGVRGVIVNEADLKLIPRASKAIASGAMWFSNGVLSESIDAHSHISTDGKTVDRASVLTRREREVLSLLAQGKKNKKIAEKLGLSYRTVVTHVYNIYRKLKISSRTEAIHFAIANNLVDVKRS